MVNLERMWWVGGRGANVKAEHPVLTGMEFTLVALLDDSSTVTKHETLRRLPRAFPLFLCDHGARRLRRRRRQRHANAYCDQT
jgi:hypothetical protein